MTRQKFNIGDRVKLTGGPECYAHGTILDFGETGATVNIERIPDTPELDSQISVPWAQIELE